MDARSGGKMVTNRRRRLAPGPYDRPPQPSEHSSKSPNWLTGHVFPATRTIISGAAKIITSVFNSDSGSSSSSSSDSDSMFEDDAREENDILSKVDELNKDPQQSEGRSKTKHLLEQLLMQETFTRRECDRLVTIINSRVVDSSSLEGEGSFRLPSAIADQTVADDTMDLSSQAIIEARKWLEEKRDGLGSEITCGGLCSLAKNVGDIGSPVDMAKSYMKVRPPWSSPAVDHSALRTPSLKKAKLFEEGTPYSVSGDPLSSLKKRSSLASGSWNIQDEIKKVRSKATEDLLRSIPSKETDCQLHLVDCKAERKLAVGDLMGTSTSDKINDSSSSRYNKLSDVPIKWSDVEITQDGGEKATLPLDLAPSIQLRDKVTEVIQFGEHTASESHRPSGPVFHSEHSEGLHITGSDGQEVVRPIMAQNSNGYTSSLEAGLSGGQNGGQNNDHVSADKLKSRVSSQDKSAESTPGEQNKSTKSIPVDNMCEFLSESTDVPDMNDTTRSPAVSSMRYEELSRDKVGLVCALPTNADGKGSKQQGKRPARYAARKTKGMGK